MLFSLPPPLVSISPFSSQFLFSLFLPSLLPIYFSFPLLPSFSPSSHSILPSYSFAYFLPSSLPISHSNALLPCSSRVFSYPFSFSNSPFHFPPPPSPSSPYLFPIPFPLPSPMRQYGRRPSQGGRSRSKRNLMTPRPISLRESTKIRTAVSSLVDEQGKKL